MFCKVNVLQVVSFGLKASQMYAFYRVSGNLVCNVLVL